MSHAPTSPDDVMRALRAFRYHAGTEPELHTAIATALTIPAPGALALMGIGGLVMGRRRR